MAKAAKKTSAKKSTKKTASAKASAKKAVVKAEAPKKNNRDNSVTLQKLYKFNLFASFANLVFAVLSVIFLSKESVSVVLTYSTKDELASTSGSVLGTAYKTFLTMEIRYVLAVIFVLTAIFALLLATRLRNLYEVGVKNSVSAIRWLFAGITLGTSLGLATMLSGVEDFATLKIVGLLIVVTTILGFLSERENKDTKKHYALFSLSLLTGVMAWLPLAVSWIGTTLYGGDSFGWHVYALGLLLFVGFSSIALAQYRSIRDGVSAKGYLQVEGKYVSTDFLIKLGIFAILILALHK